MKIVIGIFIGLFIAFGILSIYSLCVAAKRGDGEI